MRAALRDKKYAKVSGVRHVGEPELLEHLGMGAKDYMMYLENQFTGRNHWMSWDRHGNLAIAEHGDWTWEIDHKIALGNFDLNILSERIKAFHWSNTQPMKKSENRAKSDKLTAQALGMYWVGTDTEGQWHEKKKKK